MSQFFTGTFRRSLDGKKRILIPSEIRDALDADDRRGLYVIPGKRFFLLWPHSCLEAYGQELAVDPFKDQTAAQKQRAFYSRMQFKTFDGTGRIVIPKEFADRFPDQEVVIVGVGRYLELWNPADWEAQDGSLDFG